MHYASVKSFAGCGLNITPITIDAHISRGLPQFNIVGQVHASTKESKYRVRAAILNSGFSFPNGNILINLAPAHIPKMGSGTDLGIAIAILAASQQIPESAIKKPFFYAELSLDGALTGCPELATIFLKIHQLTTPLITSAQALKFAGIIPPSQREKCHLFSASKRF